MMGMEIAPGKENEIRYIGEADGRVMIVEEGRLNVMVRDHVCRVGWLIKVSNYH